MLAPSTRIAGLAYRRHRPEQTVLYSVIAEHYPCLVEEVECSGGHLPSFVRQEFEDYLKCGLLERGFLRVKCDGCRHEHPGSSLCRYPGQGWAQRLKRVAPDGDGYGFRAAQARADVMKGPKGRN